MKEETALQAVSGEKCKGFKRKGKARERVAFFYEAP